MLIVADDKIPFLRGALEPFAEIRYLPGGQITAADVKNADALITRTRTLCRHELLNGSKVRFIATATIGYDHIDTYYCKENGIIWTNAPGCNSSSVMQYIVSAILNTAVRKKIALEGKCLGIIGAGNVGRKVKKAAESLGMQVLVCDPPREEKEGSSGFCSLSKVLENSDFITLHVPLSSKGDFGTFHMADRDFFRRMKKGAFFINSSRGEVTDTEAIKDALSSGHIDGACLDVWENEPHIDTELMKMSDISTPHIAGYSTDGKANGTAMSVNAVAEFFKIPLEKWYPDFVPPPENPMLKLCGKTFEEKLAALVNQTYNVMRDNSRLRSAPDDFEKQRGDYPLRREFQSYTVMHCEQSPDGRIQKAVTELGFNVR